MERSTLEKRVPRTDENITRRDENGVTRRNEHAAPCNGAPWRDENGVPFHDEMSTEHLGLLHAIPIAGDGDVDRHLGEQYIRAHGISWLEHRTTKETPYFFLNGSQL